MEKRKQLLNRIEKRQQDIYDKLIGAVISEKICSIFDDGSHGDRLYNDIYKAKMRLNQRLGLDGDEDADVELIIDNMFEICRLVGYKMFDYGYEEKELSVNESIHL